MSVNIPAVVEEDRETIHVLVPIHMFIPAYAEGDFAAVRLGQLDRMRAGHNGLRLQRE